MNCCVQSVGGRALVVSDQDYPSLCAAVDCVSGAEPLVLLIKIFKFVCGCVLCVGGRDLCISDQDYPCVRAAVYYVLRQSPWCI